MLSALGGLSSDRRNETVDAFNWLHLTDLHWGLPGQRHWWPTIREEFFEKLPELHSKTGPWHAVLFTGDLVQQGSSDEFAALEDKVLGPLWEQFQKLECNPVLLAVPGNHDLIRPKAKTKNAAVHSLRTPGRFQEIAEDFWEEKSQYRQALKRIFANYCQWWATRPHCENQAIYDSPGLPGDFSTTFVTDGDHKIGILGLNTAFLHMSDDIKAGHLACDLRQFHEACEGGDGVVWAKKHDVCLLMSHQGPDWFDEPSRTKEYSAINPAGRFAVHLFGHMHKETLRGFSQGGGSTVRRWQGNSLFGMEHYGDQKQEERRHGYSAGTIIFDGDHVLLRHWPRAAVRDDVNGWRFVRDEINCKLIDDGGTKPEDISPDIAPREHREQASHKPPAEPIEQVTARALGNQHRAVQQAWDARWSGVVGEDDDLTNPENNKPPFVSTQGLRLLLDTDQPQRFLRAEYFRAGRGVGPSVSAADLGMWARLARADVVAGQTTLDDGSPCSLRRLAITTDAGVGKTIALRWLSRELNRPGGGTAAFLLHFHQLPVRAEDLIRHTLVPQLQHASGNEASQLSAADAAGVLESLRQQGRIVLLLDALDQAPPDGAAVQVLRSLLEDHGWDACRIVISGRPHALQRHWEQLFATGLGFGWRFVQLDEFDLDQQRAFLGQADDGRDRYDLIPETATAREILSTPRVLEYLRELPDQQLRLICTAGDVYWHSINHLLKEGLKNSEAARHLGLAPDERTPATVQARSLARGRELLGAIAFRMTATLTPRAGSDAGELAPNFDGVPPGQFRRFTDDVYQLLARRPGAADRTHLDRDIDSLAALNDFLSHGIFDTDVAGLDRIFWRNRTLQEFFTAYWLAQFCSQADAAGMGDWITLPERPLSEEYYWVWRFLCEMHEDAREPQTWTRAVEPLLRPGDGTAEGTRRSSELIYRVWQPLDQLAASGNADARRVQEAFLSEFEHVILAGQRGEQAQQTSCQFRDSFIDVPAGKFYMGSPPDKQGMPEDLRQRWKEYVERDGDPEERAAAHITNWSFSPGKQGQEWRDWEFRWWTDVFRDKDMDAVVRRYFRSNETPEEPIQALDGFCFNRWPTINAWYRLFDPGHGTNESWYREVYSRISPDADTPAIFVTWFDAWAFCLWARWQGASCRLPHEHEWEYAAKADTPWDQNYWWGDQFDSGKCNGDQNVGRTTAPAAKHENPWRFQDILGNVLEWCQDVYHPVYSRDNPDDPTGSSARVLRGGSWDDGAAWLRSAFRGCDDPADAIDYVGFRVARALHRKP